MTTQTRINFRPANMSMQLSTDWKHTRDIYELLEDDHLYFPLATHRIALTAMRHQSDPLFVCVPCWIKPGTKHQLCIALSETKVIQAQIKKVFNWN